MATNDEFNSVPTDASSEENQQIDEATLASNQILPPNASAQQMAEAISRDPNNRQLQEQILLQTGSQPQLLDEVDKEFQRLQGSNATKQEPARQNRELTPVSENDTDTPLTKEEKVANDAVVKKVKHQKNTQRTDPTHAKVIRHHKGDLEAAADTLQLSGKERSKFLSTNDRFAEKVALQAKNNTSQIESERRKAKERGRTLFKKGTQFNENTTWQEYNSNKAALTELRKLAFENRDIDVNSNPEAWSSQEAATVAIAASNIAAGLESTPLAVLSYLKRGSLSERSEKTLKLIQDLEAQKSKNEANLNEFLNLVDSDPAFASDAQIEQRRKITADENRKLDAQIVEYQNLLEQEAGTAERLESVSDRTLKTISEGVDAASQGQILNTIGSEVKLFGQGAINIPQIATIAHAGLTGKSDADLIREANVLQEMASQVQEDSEAFAERIRDPKIQAQLDQELVTTWNNSADKRQQFMDAKDAGNDVEASQLLGELVAELGIETATAFANNPYATAHLAGEELPQFFGGGIIKVGGKALTGNRLKDLKKARADIRKGEAKVIKDIENKYRKSDLAPEQIAAAKKTELTAVRERTVRNMRAIDSLGDVAGTSMIVGESAGQGVMIYNQAIEDYIEKTGRSPDAETMQTIFLFSLLAGSADLGADLFIKQTQGLLKKVVDSHKKAGKTGLDAKEIARKAKGISNRAILATGVKSTLSKTTQATLRPSAAAALEGSTEVFQTDLELNLANYLLGTDLAENTALQRFIAGAKGAAVGGVLTAPITAVDTASAITTGAVTAGAATALAGSAAIDRAQQFREVDFFQNVSSPEQMQFRDEDFQAIGTNLSNVAANAPRFESSIDKSLETLEPTKIPAVLNNLDNLKSRVIEERRKLVKAAQTAVTEDKGTTAQENTKKAQAMANLEAAIESITNRYEAKLAQEPEVAEVATEAEVKPEEAPTTEKTEAEAAEKKFLGSSRIFDTDIDTPEKVAKLQRAAEIQGNLDFVEAIFNKVSQRQTQVRKRKEIGEASTNVAEEVAQGSGRNLGYEEAARTINSILRAYDAGTKSPQDKDKAIKLLSRMRGIQQRFKDNQQKKLTEAQAIFQNNETALQNAENRGIRNPKGWARGIIRDVPGEIEQLDRNIAYAQRSINNLQENIIEVDSTFDAAPIPASETVTQPETSEQVPAATEQEAEPPSEEALEEPVSEVTGEETVSEDTTTPVTEAPVEEPVEVPEVIEVLAEEPTNPSFDPEQITVRDKHLGKDALEQLPEQIAGSESIKDTTPEFSYKNLLPVFFKPSRKNPLKSLVDVVLIPTANYIQNRRGTDNPTDLYVMDLTNTVYETVRASLNVSTEAQLKKVAHKAFGDKTIADQDLNFIRTLAGQKANNLFRYLLNADKTEIPHEFRQAIALGITKFITDHGESINNMEPENLNSLFGFSFKEVDDKNYTADVEIVSNGETVSVKEKYQHQGFPDILIAEEIGKNAVRALGLVEDSDGSEGFSQQLELALGQLGLYVLSEQAANKNTKPGVDTLFTFTTQTYDKFLEDRNQVWKINGKSVDEESDSSRASREVKYFKFNLPNNRNEFLASENNGLLATYLGWTPMAPEAVQNQVKNLRSKNEKVQVAAREWLNRYAALRTQNKPKGARFRFDKLFYNTRSYPMPFTKAEDAKNTNYSNDVPKKKQEKLDKHSQTAYIPDSDIADFLVAVSQLESYEDQVRALGLLGFIDLDTLENSIAATRKSQEGKNIQIMNSVDNILAFLEESGYNTENFDADKKYYYKTDTQSQGRLQFTPTIVNPLLKKIDRSFMKVAGNSPIPVDMSDRDSALNVARKLAILQKMKKAKDTDGIDKINDNWEEFVNEAAVLKSDSGETIATYSFADVVNFYATLQQNGYSNKNIAEDQAENIEEAWNVVQAFTNSADYHSGALEVLNDEINRQIAEAQGKDSYDTALNVSMDGISSGVTLGIYQLSNGGEAAKATLNKMGLFWEDSATTNLQEVADSGDPDGYEEVAFSFINMLARVGATDALSMQHIARQEARLSGLSKGTDKYKRTKKEVDRNIQYIKQARNFLYMFKRAYGIDLETFNTDPKQRQKLRSVMKHSVLAKVFGQEGVGLSEGIAEWIIDATHETLEGIAQNPNMTEQEKVADATKVHARLAPFVTRFYNIDKDLSIVPTFGNRSPIQLFNPKDLTSIDLRAGNFRSMARNFNQLEGLSSAFDIGTGLILHNFVEQRNYINSTFNIQALLYKFIYESETESALEKHEEKNPIFTSAIMNLPKKKREALDKELWDIAPKIQSYYSDNTFDEALPLFNHEMGLVEGSFRSSLGIRRKRGMTITHSAAGFVVKPVHELEAGGITDTLAESEAFSAHDANYVTLDRLPFHQELINRKFRESNTSHSIWDKSLDALDFALPKMLPYLKAINESGVEVRPEMVNDIERAMNAWIVKTVDPTGGVEIKNLDQAIAFLESDIIPSIAEKREINPKIDTPPVRTQHYAAGFGGSLNGKFKDISNEPITEQDRTAQPEKQTDISFRNTVIAGIKKSQSKNPAFVQMREHLNHGLTGQQAIDEVKNVEGFNKLNGILKRNGYDLETIAKLPESTERDHHLYNEKPNDLEDPRAEEDFLGSSRIPNEDPFKSDDDTEVFDINADNITEKLSVLQNSGDRPESASNMAHLLNILGNVYNNHIPTIRASLNQKGHLPTVGRIAMDSTDMELNIQKWTNGVDYKPVANKLGIPMSGAEVLAHETIHALTKNLIKDGHPIINEIEKIYKAVKASNFVQPEDLIPEGFEHTPEMLAAARETYDYIFKAKTEFVEDVPVGGASSLARQFSAQRKGSRHLHEFVAYMATNEKLRQKLTETVSINNDTDQDTRFNIIKSTAADLLKRVFRFLSGKLGNYRFDSTDPAYTKQFDDLMRDLFVIEARTNNKVMKVLGTAANGVNKVTDAAIDVGVYTLNGTRKSKIVTKGAEILQTNSNFLPAKLATTVGKSIVSANDFLNEYQADKTALDKGLGVLSDKFEDVMAGANLGIAGDLLTELRGTTDRNKWASILIRLRNTFEAKVRQETMDVYMKVLMEPFLKDLAPGTKTVPPEVSRVLHTVFIRSDAAALLSASPEFPNGMNRDDFASFMEDLLTDPTVLTNEIAKARDRISKHAMSDEVGNNYHKAAQSLGYYQLHQTYLNGIGLNSTHAITQTIPELYGSNIDPESAVFKELNSAINLLSTLHAIEFMTDGDKASAASILKDHSQRTPQDDGVWSLVSAHHDLQEKARNSSLFTDPQNFVKGYNREVSGNPDLHYEVAEEKDEAEMFKRGYTPVTKWLHNDSLNPVKRNRVLYVNEFGAGGVTYTQGGFSTADTSKRKGTSLFNRKRVFMYEDAYGNAVYDIDQEKQSWKDRRHSHIIQLGKSPVNDNLDLANHDFHNTQYNFDTVPGKDRGLLDIRAQMQWSDKVRYLSVRENPFESLALTAGNHVSKVRGREVNRVVVDEVIIDARKNRASMPASAYTFVGADRGTKDDQKRWALLPKETRLYIEQTTGEKGFWVRKDLRNSVFGYRKVSLRSFLDYLNENPEDQKAFKQLLTKVANHQLGHFGLKVAIWSEDAIIDLTANIKDTVVTKSLIVNAGNVMSNTIQLIANGLSITDAIKLQLEAVEGATQYSKDHTRITEIETKLAALTTPSQHRQDLEEELAELNDSISRNVVTPLMEAGAMQTIVEDIEEYTLGDPDLKRKPLTNFGNKVLDNSPEFLSTSLSYAVMHSDTPFYKMANNAVKHSDFAARYALIKHLERSNPDNSFDKNVQEAMDQFIDYDIPTNRWIQYMNDVGLLWFTKYGIRASGVAAKLVYNQPRNVAKIFLLQMLFGTDFGTVFDANPTARFNTPVGKLGGAIDIHPTVNIADTVGLDF